jgi:hypothetical protein
MRRKREQAKSAAWEKNREVGVNYFFPGDLMKSWEYSGEIRPTSNQNEMVAERSLGELTQWDKNPTIPTRMGSIQTDLK